MWSYQCVKFKENLCVGTNESIPFTKISSLKFNDDFRTMNFEVFDSSKFIYNLAFNEI